MNELHLTEQQLQEHAFTRVTDAAAARHIAGCAHCRLQISVYQILYNHILEAETPLLDLTVEELLPELLPEINREDRKDARYLYGFLFGAAALLNIAVISFWGTFSWLFAGMTPLAIVLSLSLLSAFLLMQLTEVYRTYRKKLSALDLAQTAT